MNAVTKALSARSHAAAAYVEKVGWTQGTMKDDDGKVCATGAVMYCQPQNGDEHIIRGVLQHRGTAESWNDKEGRTEAEVREALDRDITDADLTDTYGPQALEIVAVIRRSAILTSDEAKQFDAAWNAAWNPARGAARGAAWNPARNAARGAARGVALDAAWGAAMGAAWDAAWNAAWDAARNAAAALVIRDLIGQDGFTQEHYDKLTGPWRRVIGKIHPEDADMKENSK